MAEADAHDRILALAKSALDAEVSPLWKTDMDTAVEVHAERCEALWDELRRQVCEVGADNIASLPSRIELERQWRKEFVDLLRKRLPELISEAVEI